MDDLSSYVVHRAATLLEACKAVEAKVEGYLVTTDDRPDLAGEFLKMLMAADDLLQVAEPDGTSGEFHGLPKEVVSGARKAAAFQNERGWDFRPWFAEKASSAKEGVKRAIRYWEMNPDEVTLHPGAPMTPREWVREGILTGLHAVRGDGGKIFSMTFDDSITVQSDAGRDGS